MGLTARSTSFKGDVTNFGARLEYLNFELGVLNKAQQLKLGRVEDLVAGLHDLVTVNNYNPADILKLARDLRRDAWGVDSDQLPERVRRQLFTSVRALIRDLQTRLSKVGKGNPEYDPSQPRDEGGRWSGSGGSSGASTSAADTHSTVRNLSSSVQGLSQGKKGSAKAAGEAAGELIQTAQAQNPFNLDDDTWHELKQFMIGIALLVGMSLALYFIVPKHIPSWIDWLKLPGR